MKLAINTIVITLMTAVLTACATTSNPYEHLSPLDYDINTYQPPCQRVTQTMGGAIVGEYTQCPQVQYYCTFKGTGQRIQCPKFNMEKYNQAMSQLDYMHWQELCDHAYRANLDWREGMVKIKSSLAGQKNPLCDEYGNPNPR